MTGGEALTLAACLIVAPLAGAQAQLPEPASDWPWSSVSRVLVEGRGTCSGVLVGSRAVLTAGHCVATGDPWTAHPTASLSVDFDGVRVEVVSVHLPQSGPLQIDGRVGNMHHDWALLELADYPSRQSIPFGGRAMTEWTHATGAPMFKVGFAAEQRRRDVACSVIAIAPEGNVFAFRCPGGAGQGRSGSALLVRDGDRYAVLGVQSAETQGETTTLGMAVIPPY